MHADERMRERLTAALADEPAPMDSAAAERVARAVALRGPAIVRAARLRRRVLASAGGALALAACALLALAVQRGSVATPTTATRTTTTPAPVAHRETPIAPANAVTPAAPALAADVRACSRRAPVTGAAFVRASGGGTRADLGALALLVASRGAGVRFETVEPCRTVVALASGRVTVHARDLGGGELRVATAAGDVVVHGTVFAVERRGSVTRVSVARGSVSVARGARVIARLGGGEQVRVDGREASSAAPRTERLGSRAIAALVRTVGLDPAAAGEIALREPGVRRASAAAPSSAPSLEALVQDAAVRARAGDLEAARVLYARAGAGTGPTAEAAWLALARIELGAGRTVAARNALAERVRRFPSGALGEESAYLALRLAQRSGDAAGAQAAARALVQRWPHSPYAPSAVRVLAHHGAP